MSENPGAVRRRRFIERGYRQVECYLSEVDYTRIRIAVAMFGNVNQINDVVERAVKEWLDRNDIPQPRQSLRPVERK